MPFDLRPDRLHLEPRDSLILAGALGLVGVSAAVVLFRQPSKQTPPAPAQRGPSPCPTTPGALVSDGSPGGKVYAVCPDGHRHWVQDGLQFLLCLYNPSSVVTCDVGALPEGASVGDLGCCPGADGCGC